MFFKQEQRLGPVCYYLHSRGLGRTRILHKYVMAESRRFCCLAESLASLQTGFRSAGLPLVKAMKTL